MHPAAMLAGADRSACLHMLAAIRDSARQAVMQAANSKLWRGRDLVNGTAGLQPQAEASSATQQGRQLMAGAAEDFEV